MAMEEKAKEKEFLDRRFGSNSTTKKNKVFGGNFFQNKKKEGNLDMFFVVLVCNDYLDANP